MTLCLWIIAVQRHSPFFNTKRVVCDHDGLFSHVFRLCPYDREVQCPISHITMHNASHRPTGPHSTQIEQDNHQGYFEHVYIMSLATLVIVVGCGHPSLSWNTWGCILLLPQPVKEEQPRSNRISAVSLIFALLIC